MKVGDLITVNYNGEPNDVGIIVECIGEYRGKLFRVLWMDGLMDELHENDLKVINEMGS